MCDKAALYENLVIDGYFQDVIASQKLGVDDNEIQLHPDGSWSTLANKPDMCNLETPKKNLQVEVISDDLGSKLKYYLFIYLYLYILSIQKWSRKIFPSRQ